MKVISLQLLFNRLRESRWLKRELEETPKRLEESQLMLKSIRYWLKDRTSLLIFQLGVERYYGTRSPWYLDISNEQCFQDEEEWDFYDYYPPDMPKLSEYRIGWYGHESEDTIRFIKDRLRWAKKLYLLEVKTIKHYLFSLRVWDKTSTLPPRSMFSWDNL